MHRYNGTTVNRRTLLTVGGHLVLALCRMPRFSIYSLAESERARHRELVARLLARTVSAEEFRQLIIDLFSTGEVTMLARRLMAMRLLKDGCEWREIRKTLGCSIDLIRDASSRLSRGGKSLARTVERLDDVVEEMRGEISFADKSEDSETPEGMVRRYPNVFWFVHADVAAPRELRNAVAGFKRVRNARKEKPR